MPIERHLVPVYLPRGVYAGLRRVKRAFIPPHSIPAAINIEGERNVEWSFLSSEMPSGPGEAIEFGCEHGYMSLMAAQRGFHVLANDLEEQHFTWQHPNVVFRQGDFLQIPLVQNYFDLAINCSSVEHVGVVGRYGIEVDQDQGDIKVMDRLAQVLKPRGILLMTAPCGKDALMAPWCRVYGSERLPKVLAPFSIVKQEYWTKNDENRWVKSSRDAALSFKPTYDPSNAHGCAYALGCFVLQKN